MLRITNAFKGQRGGSEAAAGQPGRRGREAGQSRVCSNRCLRGGRHPRPAARSGQGGSQGAGLRLLLLLPPSKRRPAEAGSGRGCCSPSSNGQKRQEGERLCEPKSPWGGRASAKTAGPTVRRDRGSQSPPSPPPPRPLLHRTP